jgi:peptidoglycan/xylan/chitin deacetylase (PgdA/CDA1 family)
MTEKPSRRGFLGAALAGVVGLAGCSGGDPDGTPTVTDTPTRTPEPRARFQSHDPCSPPTGTELTYRERLRCRGRPIEGFDDATGWRPWAGDAALVEDPTASGTSAVRVSAESNDERCGIVVEFDAGVDLSAHDVSVAVRFEDPPADAVSVGALAPDFENSVRSVRPGYEAGWIRLDHGHRKIRGDPDLTDVRALRIGTYVPPGETATMYLDSVRGTKRRDRGLVAFTFDDIHRSQYEKAFPVMEEYGFPGAVGVIPRATRLQDKVGLDGLEEMQSAGWDVVSHPQRSESLRELPAEEVRSAIADTKRWLLEHGFDSGARFLIWPYGAYDRASLGTAARHHDLGFSTSVGVAGRITDPLLVPRVDAEDAAFAKRMVDVADRLDQLCVLTFHRICSNGVTMEEFREIVRRVDAADVDVVSLSELRSRLPDGTVSSRPSGR